LFLCGAVETQDTVAFSP